MFGTKVFERIILAPQHFAEIKEYFLQRIFSNTLSFLFLLAMESDEGLEPMGLMCDKDEDEDEDEEDRDEEEEEENLRRNKRSLEIGEEQNGTKKHKNGSAEDFDEPVVLPVRLRMKWKKKKYWCTLNRVSHNQEVESVTLDDCGKPGTAECKSLSEAARKVTGLPSANGWLRWQLQKGDNWISIGGFRKEPSRNSRFRDIKGGGIRPRGQGFVNTTVIGQTKEDSAPQRRRITCKLKGNKKNLMVFIDRDKTVEDLLSLVNHTYGPGMCLIVEGYHVLNDTPLVNLILDDRNPVIEAVVKRDL